MTLFQTIFVPVCTVIAITVLVRTLRGHVLRRNGFFWALIWLGAASLIAFPDTTQRIARWLGIGRGADLVLYLAILTGLATALHFYSRFRRIETLMTGMLRREALGGARKGTRAIAASSSENTV